MGYHVKIEELLDIQQSILSQVGEWRTQLEQVQKALSEVAQTRTVKGKMGESVRSYVSEVHLQLVESLHKMLDEFVIRFTMYARGYYDIDNSNEAEIAQDLLEDQQEKLMREREEFDSLAEEVTKILRSVNDIVSIGSPDQGAAVGSTSMLYGLSNVGEGADSLYLGFTGDGTTVAVNPIRDTLFASNPGLYYTIGNKSTQLSAMALRVGGPHMSVLKVGTSPLLGLTEGKGKLIVNGVKGGKVPKYLMDQMGKTSLSTQLGIGVGKQPGSGVKKIEKPSGFPFKGSVSSIEGASGANEEST